MSRITQPGTFAPLELFSTNSFPGGTYNYGDLNFDTYTGMRFQASDGRSFTIVQNGATALVAGKTVGGPAAIAAHEGMAVAAFTAYSNNGNQPAQVTVTLGATAVTANQYAGGFLITETNTGAGQTLKVASHPAANASANLVVTLENPDGENMVALDTTTTASLFLNKYGSGNGTNVSTFGVVVGAHASPTLNIIGASLYGIPASSGTPTSNPEPSYGFIQVGGDIALLNQGGTSAGLDIMPSTSTDGAFATYAVASGTRIGVAREAGTNAQYSLVTLQGL